MQPWPPCPARVEKKKKGQKARNIITICKMRACSESRLLKQERERKREKERAREIYRERLAGRRSFEPRARGYFLPRKPPAAA